MNPSIEFIDNYFFQEKIESLIFIILGLISISVALFFFTIIKYSLYKGVACVFLLIGFFQFCVGITVFNKALNDRDGVETLVIKKTQTINNNELTCMPKVVNSFWHYKLIEITFIVLGFFMFLKFKKLTQQFYKGIGLGLVIQGSILFVLNLVAQSRAF